jgi:hypothetical protein
MPNACQFRITHAFTGSQLYFHTAQAVEELQIDCIGTFVLSRGVVAPQQVDVGRGLLVAHIHLIYIVRQVGLRVVSNEVHLLIRIQRKVNGLFCSGRCKLSISGGGHILAVGGAVRHCLHSVFQHIDTDTVVCLPCVGRGAGKRDFSGKGNGYTSVIHLRFIFIIATCGYHQGCHADKQIICFHHTICHFKFVT